MEGSYETHFNKYPLGLGVPAGLVTSFSDWQSKYSGIDPIENVAKGGAFVRQLWSKYV